MYNFFKENLLILWNWAVCTQHNFYLFTLHHDFAIKGKQLLPCIFRLAMHKQGYYQEFWIWAIKFQLVKCNAESIWKFEGGSPQKSLFNWQHPCTDHHKVCMVEGLKVFWAALIKWSFIVCQVYQPFGCTFNINFIYIASLIDSCFYFQTYEFEHKLLDKDE